MEILKKLILKNIKGLISIDTSLFPEQLIFKSLMTGDQYVIERDTRLGYLDFIIKSKCSKITVKMESCIFNYLSGKAAFKIQEGLIRVMNWENPEKIMDFEEVSNIIKTITEKQGIDFIEKKDKFFVSGPEGGIGFREVKGRCIYMENNRELLNTWIKLVNLKFSNVKISLGNSGGISIWRKRD